MFTGLVQHLGSVQTVSLLTAGAGQSLRVSIAGWSHTPALGESIAINGCCLTVAEVADQTLRFDVIAQTLGVTTIGEVRRGEHVNMEHSVTPTSLLGGHIVQGHVDAVGIVRQALRSAEGHRLRIVPPTRQAMRLIVDKGSIAVNGASLTVAAVGDDWFEVALIPTTLALTNLGLLTDGDRVNLEYDYLAKVVVNWLERRNG